MPDTPPEVGSLWLHESGERRYVMEVYDDSMRYHDGHFTQFCSLTDWLAWEANARRIDQ